MDWRKHFNELKLGDSVKLLRPSQICSCYANQYHRDHCCKEFVGLVGKITVIKSGGRYTVDFKGVGLGCCNFEKECLQKVIQ